MGGGTVISVHWSLCRWDVLLNEIENNRFFPCAIITSVCSVCYLQAQHTNATLRFFDWLSMISIPSSLSSVFICKAFTQHKIQLLIKDVLLANCPIIISNHHKKTLNQVITHLQISTQNFAAHALTDRNLANLFYLQLSAMCSVVFCCCLFLFPISGRLVWQRLREQLKSH